MKFNYSRIETPKLKAHIHIEFEHGDADCTSHVVDTMSCTSSTELTSKLSTYIQKFEKFANAIYALRTNGKEDKELMNLAEQEPSIPIELDCYAKQHMGFYYANMRIVGVVWYDEMGNGFDVSWTT